eukprot:scaffold69769_cov75-Phaeocystis_antarctica.AAC.1
MMTANGGTWYVRGASPEGPVQRVFASAFERALQACSCVLEAYPESEAAALGLPNKVAAQGLPPSAASGRLGRRLEAEARGGWGG